MSAPLRETPSQTAGPFLHIGMMPDGAAMRPLHRAAPADGVLLGGGLFDAEGAPVADALIEMMQEGGVWARCATDGAGAWSLRAARPGARPFVDLWIVARGINLGLHTRLYFPDADRSADNAMARIPVERRETLVASKGADGAYRLDIRLGGPHETVFFDA